MAVNRQQFDIIFRQMASGFELVGNHQEGFAFVLRLGGSSLEPIIHECDAKGCHISRVELRYEITQFMHSNTAYRMPLTSDIFVRDIFSGEILELCTSDAHSIELVKVNFESRFWIANDNVNNGKLNGVFVDFPKEMNIYEGMRLVIGNRTFKIERIYFLTPTVSMLYLSSLLSPSVCQYSCTNDLERDVILPFYDWCLEHSGNKVWVSISEWEKLCHHVEQAGLDAFVSWYLINHMVNNYQQMYL